MILVRSSHTIRPFDGPQMLRNIEEAARTCYLTEPKGDQQVTEQFVRNLIRRGHESTLEHEQISVRIVCSRGVSHEAVRHRICAFSQESTRYVDYNKGQCCFVIPSWVDLEPGEYTIPPMEANTPVLMWFCSCLRAEADYKALRAAGWRPEHARDVLPNGTKTELVMTANVREWRHILRLRTGKAAHPDMQALMLPLLADLKTRVNVLFEDINPES